MGINVVELVL